ncbi:uncharacterized protein K441DRAFT_542205, partial [Cenococcum geophilum 1.58]|uniref:uncharacterized protein n=1 Tax=Cenococcum geophilum 1.58 TaxID=794803 RepID=UPI00358E7CCA
NVLYVKWKNKVLDQPFFYDVSHITRDGNIIKEKAFPYAKYRDIFVRLGLIARFKEALELYQLRQALGKNINDTITPEERNQTMGHLSSIYKRYYIPTHIARDYQSIYFGSPL